MKHFAFIAPLLQTLCGDTLHILCHFKTQHLLGVSPVESPMTSPFANRRLVAEIDRSQPSAKSPMVRALHQYIDEKARSARSGSSISCVSFFERFATCFGVHSTIDFGADNCFHVGAGENRFAVVYAQRPTDDGDTSTPMDTSQVDSPPSQLKLRRQSLQRQLRTDRAPGLVPVFDVDISPERLAGSFARRYQGRVSPVRESISRNQGGHRQSNLDASATNLARRRPAAFVRRSRLAAHLAGRRAAAVAPGPRVGPAHQASAAALSRRHLDGAPCRQQPAWAAAHRRDTHRWSCWSFCKQRDWSVEENEGVEMT